MVIVKGIFFGDGWDGREMDNERLLVLIKWKKDSYKVGYNAA